MIDFKIGDICEIDNPLQKKNGRVFEILEFIYDRDDSYFPPIGFKVKYLDTNRKGTYMNSFDSLNRVG